MSEIEFTDRYSATGRPRPRLLTVCGGQCEGMGCYPLRAHDPLPSYFEKYPHMLTFSAACREELTEHEHLEVERIQAEAGVQEDGYYFVRYGECGGSGRCSRWRSLLRLPAWVWSGARFLWHMNVRPYPELSAGESRLRRFFTTLRIAVTS